MGQEENDLSDNIKTQTVSFYWIDFRHNRDAFSFPNPFIEHWYDYFTEIGAVIKEAKVTHKAAAVLGGWFLEFLSIRGHCFGMASASTIWYMEPGEKPIAIPTYEMSYDKEKVKAEIVLYHWRGILSMVPGLTERLLFYDAEKQYDLILRDIKSGEPAVIALWDLPSGHATMAYKILDLGDKKHVYVYENELPLDLKKADYDMEFNISSNEGKYELLGFDKVIFVPKKLFVTPLEWSDIQELIELINKQLWENKKIFFWVHSCAVPLLIDEFGRRIGYVDGTFINEISDTKMKVVLDSYLFSLPMDLTYSAQITGTDTGMLGLDFVMPISESRAKVVTYKDIPITSGSKATTTFSAIEVPSKVTLS